MNKKVFFNKLTIITTIITFILTTGASVLLGYYTLNKVRTPSSQSGIYNYTELHFEPLNAIGYFIFGLVLTLIVYLVCVCISAQKQNIKNND